MAAFQSLFGHVILLICLTVPGYVLGKCRKLDEAALVSIGNILTYVAMPFLVFYKLFSADLRLLGGVETAVCILLPFVLIPTLYGLSLLILPKRGGHAAVGHFCAIFSNCGFLGIPLAAALFPWEPRIGAYIAFFNVSATFLLLTLGEYILSGDRKNISFKRAIFSPVMLAIVLGTVCLLLRVSESVPSVGTYASYLANLTTPLSMLVLGFELSRLRFGSLVCNRLVYSVAGIRLLLAPVLTLGIMFLLRLILGMHISHELVSAMFLSTAVSTAASAPAMAKKHGKNAEQAAALTLGNTILCVLTLPLLYLLVELIF